MRGGDITQALTMLHTTVVHTGNDVRDTLGKGVERLANGRELAHKEVLAKLDDVAQGEATQKALSGVREELRTVGRSVGSLRAKVEEAGPAPAVDVRGEVTAALGPLGAEVKGLTELLGAVREELVKLREAEPRRSAEAASPGSAEGRTAGPHTGDPGHAEAAAGAEAGCPNAGHGPADRPEEGAAASAVAPEEGPGSATAPEPSAAGAVPPPSAPVPAPPAATVLEETALIPSPRAALADALKEVVAPLRDELARARTERLERGEDQGRPERQEGYGEGELAVKYDELTDEVAYLRQVLVGITGRAEGEGTPAEAGPEAVVTPAAGCEPVTLVPVDATAHRRLLLQAARVSSTVLVCHRDVWEFVSATAGRHRHFRMPPEVVDEGAGRVSAALSGRSLIAILISLHRIRAADDDGDGDLPLATTLYLRIEQALTALASDGVPLTIVLDDRSAPDLRDAAASGARHRRDPDGAEGRRSPEHGGCEPSRSPEGGGEALAG